MTVTYTQAQLAGDLNVVVVGWNDSTAQIASVTDSKGNTYALAVGPTVQSMATQAIYFAKNIVAAAWPVNDPQNSAVSWSTVGTVSAVGLFTPGSQVGVHTVTATSNSNPPAVSASGTTSGWRTSSPTRGRRSHPGCLQRNQRHYSALQQSERRHRCGRT